MTLNTALVVDDSKVARLTLTKLLRLRDLEIIEHTSAESALSWLTDASDKPDIIFMDVMMEGMDGLQATEIIKSDSSIHQIPVIICSGSDGGVAREKVLSAGANGMLSKPPSETELDELLASLIPPSASQTFETEQVTIPLDEMAIQNEPAAVERSMDEIREQLLAELENRLTLQIEAQLPSLIEQQMSVLQKQLTTQFDDAIQAQLQELQQTISAQVPEWVSLSAKSILQKAVAETDLSTAAAKSLDRMAQPWLIEQSTSLRESLLKQLEQDLVPMVNKAIQSDLAAQVTEEVEQHLNTIQQQVNDAVETALAAVMSQLNTTRIVAFVAIGIALIAIGLNFV